MYVAPSQIPYNLLRYRLIISFYECMVIVFTSDDHKINNCCSSMFIYFKLKYEMNSDHGENPNIPNVN